MRLFLNYLTRRLLVSALCSATQTALVGPGQAEMWFRHTTTSSQAQQVVGGAPHVDVLVMWDAAEITGRDSAVENT